MFKLQRTSNLLAEIITLRAIALKLYVDEVLPGDSFKAEIITLRAIALKQNNGVIMRTSKLAEIITLRAIALKPICVRVPNALLECRDHNATSYSTETVCT